MVNLNFHSFTRLRQSVLLALLLWVALPVSAQINLNCPPNETIDVDANCEVVLDNYAPATTITLAPGQELNPAKIAAGFQHSLAVDADGKLYSWGAQQFGRLGNGTNGGGSISTITQVGTDTDWLTVSTGQFSSYAIKTDGTLWAWGDDRQGQLGLTPDGDPLNSGFGDFQFSPKQVGTDNDWAAVAGGSSHTIALKNDGRVYSWGSNNNGQLGFSSPTPEVPTLVADPLNDDIVAVGAGFGRCVLLNGSGELIAWGNDIVNNGARSNPQKIGTDTDWEDFSVGSFHILMRKQDGTLYALGRNNFGELGDGTTTGRFLENGGLPVQVGTSNLWTDLSAGGQSSVALRSDGTRWAWGINSSGQYGNGTTTPSTTPVQADNDMDWSGLGVNSNNGHNFGFKDDGTVFSWGSNANGQTGPAGTSSQEQGSGSNAHTISIKELTALSVVNSLTYTQTPAPGQVFGPGPQTVTITANSSANNETGSCNFTVTIEDNTSPAAPTLATATIDCGGTVTAPTTTDNCGGVITGTTNDPVTFSGTGNYTITWNFDDGNDNDIVVEQTVDVVDQTGPAFDNCPATYTANLGAGGTVTVVLSDLGLAVSDNCGSSITPSIQAGSDLTFGCSDVGMNAGTITVDATDGTNDAAPCIISVTVTDTDNTCCSIAITSATPTAEGCPGADDGMITVVATGAASIDYTLSGNGITPVTNQTGTFAGLADGTYDVAVADASDATCSAAQTGVVVAAGTDTEAPTLTCPASFAADLDLCGDYTLTAEALNLNATDNCGGAVTVSLSQETFTGAGTTNVTVTVSDGANSDNSCVVPVTLSANPNAFTITAGADNLGTECPNTSITFSAATLLSNDNITNGQTLEIQEVNVVGGTAIGAVADNGDGTYTFTPEAGVTGTVNFTYIVKTDGDNLFNPSNGNFYEFISAPNIGWNNAKAAAEALTLNGQSGYLVTITSQAEQEFVTTRLEGFGWTGGREINPGDNKWFWVTGPEGANGGTQFEGVGTPSGAYQNWSSNEPNNTYIGGIPEDYVHLRANGQWNDYPETITAAMRTSIEGIDGYVVEYGGGTCQPDLTATGSITLSLVDTEAPVLDCKTSFDANLGTNDMVTVSASDLLNGATTDNCATTFTEAITGGDQTYGCGDVGAAAATLTVTVDDGNGNAAVSCDVTINVTDTNSECNADPTITCAPVTVDADANCMGAAAGAEFVGTSNDPDGDDLTFTVSPEGPYATGITNVTVTADDGNGGTATCMTTITVVDNQLPNAECVETITVVLDDMGNGTLTVSDVNMGSTDNCGITGMSLNVTDFSCSDLDDGMNTGDAEVADYDVEELTPRANGPNFFAQTMVAGVTGQLTSIEGLQVHNTVPGGMFPSVIELIEGHDPSGTVLYSENITATNTPTIFNLDLSTESITWTAGENYLLVVRILSGASISHAGTAAFQVGIGTSYANGRVFYFEDFSFLPAVGQALDIAFTLNVDTGAGGPTTTLTVTDAAGNEASCETSVTVVDNMAPIANCQSAFSIDLDATETVTITPGMLDNGSSDNCTVNLAIDGGDPTYTCDDLDQTFTLQLNVTDGSSNSANCTVDVTITDTDNVCYTCELGFTVEDEANGIPPGIITSRVVCGDDGEITVNAFCNGCDDGDADLRYSITPDPNGVGLQTSNVFTGLPAGDYTVTISDVDHPDCTASTSATIGECVGELPGNDTDDDCDTETDEASSIAWILLDGSETNATCTSSTDCCAQTFCYGLEYTPQVSGTLTSYTTGFLIPCVDGATPLLSSASCVMTDNSFDAADCAGGNGAFFNASGNSGGVAMVELTKDVPVILHQICLAIPDEMMINLTKDEVTDITLSITVAPVLSTDDVILVTDFPDYTTAIASGNQRPVITSGAIDACYATVAEAEAAALAATSATDDCTSVSAPVLTAATVGTCSAVITVTATDQCGLTSTFDYNTRIDGDAPTVTGTLNVLDEEGCNAADASDAVTSVEDLEAMGMTGFDIADNCTDDATLVVTFSDASTGTCPVVVTRTYTITDECSRSVTVEQTINVNDTTAPEVTGSLTMTDVEGCDLSVVPAAETTVMGLEGLIGDLEIADVCTADATLAVSHEDEVGTECPIVITRIYTITDGCNNASEVVHTIRVVDTVDPVLTPGTLANCYADRAVALQAAIDATTASDNCNGTVTLTSVSTGSCPATITVTGVDACGNDVSIDYQTVITDGIAPIETGVIAATSADIQTTLDVVEPTPPVFEDVCGNSLTGVGPSIDNQYTEGECVGTISYTWTYTDCAETESTWTFTYNVNCQGLKLRVFTEGNFDAGTGMLHTMLNANHLLPGQDKALSPNPTIQAFATATPSGHPYQVAPWLYTGQTGMGYGDGAGQEAYPAHVVDWVLVTVREDSRLPADNVWQCTGWVHENGEVTFPELCPITFDAGSTYYVVIEHRNHLAVLAEATLEGGATYIAHDFTTENSYAPVFRFGQKQIGSVWTMFTGNGDQVSSRLGINSADRTFWRSQQNRRGYFGGDFDQSLQVESNDETLWKNNQNKATGIRFD